MVDLHGVLQKSSNPPSPLKTLTILLKVSEVWMLSLQEKRMLLVDRPKWHRHPVSSCFLE